MVAFEKSDAGEGKQRRVAGIISTETRDQQGEIVLQNGLDFSYFLKSGWLNNNHKDSMADVLGYPEMIKTYRKGQILPDGSAAKGNLTWSEGYLLHTRKADEVWELARALAKTDRRLGFSIEGQILQRQGDDKKIISQAEIRHVAVTHVPVNADARLDVLMRSLQAADAAAEKAFSMGNVAHVVPGKLYSGEGAGAVLSPESIDGMPRDKNKKKRKKVAKGMDEAQAVQWCKSYIPGCDELTARQFVKLTGAFIRCSIIDP